MTELYELPSYNGSPILTLHSRNAREDAIELISSIIRETTTLADRSVDRLAVAIVDRFKIRLELVDLNSIDEPEHRPAHRLVLTQAMPTEVMTR